MKWQYLVADDEQLLNELGAQGWELVSVICKNSEMRFYFKKPFPNLKERITDDQRNELLKRFKLGDLQ